MCEISVIVPAYNAGMYIENCIRSILSQTIRNIEVIIIDDGSDDNTLDISRRLQKEDLRVKVFSKPNGGVSAARNLGLVNAVGKFITFSDADDFMEPDMLSLLYNNIIENEADISMCGDVMINLKGNKVYRFETNKKIIMNSDEAIEKLLKGNCFSSGVWTKMFRKDILKNIEFEEGRKINEDRYFIFQCLLNSKKIVYDGVCKYHYIIRENSATSAKFSDKFFDEVYFAKKISNDIDTFRSQFKNMAVYNEVNSKMHLIRKIIMDKNACKKYSSDLFTLINELRKVDKKTFINYMSKIHLIELWMMENCTKVYVFLLRIIKK